MNFTPSTYYVLFLLQEKLEKTRGHKKTTKKQVIKKITRECIDPITIVCSLYSNIQITKKVPKSDNRLSKFDWHDLSLIF